MRRSLALLLAGLAFVAAACGRDANGAQIVRTAATKTIDANSARMATTIRLSGGRLSGTITGAGAFDFTAHRGRVTMDVSGITGGNGLKSIDAVTDGHVFYVHLPPDLGAQFGGGKSWMKFDLASAARQFGLDPDQLGGAVQGDPGQALSYLRGVSNHVDDVGADTVRGAATTHYRAEVDLKKAASQLEGRQREALDKVIAHLGATTFPVDVWIDGAGRVRKMTWSQQLPSKGGEKGNVSMTMELFDFGTTVDATPPPPDQVVDLADFLPAFK